MNQMKINIVTHSISYGGGVSRASIDLANALVKQGIIVNIFSLGGSCKPKYDINTKVQIIDLKMSKPSTESYEGKLKFLWFIDATKTLSPFLSKSQYNDKDIWIFTSPPLCMLAGILKMKFKSNVFIGHEHTTSMYTKGRVIDTIRYNTYRKLDMLIALTDQDKIRYDSLAIKSTYIPNFFNNQLNPVANKRKYILFVGRFSKEKRPLLALDIYNQSKLHQEGFKLKMFGTGALEQDLRNYVHNHNLEDKVEFFTDINDVDEIYKDGYILLMTSETEGFPMVLLEAISRNIPCISFDIPYGPKSIIIDKKNGFLIKQDDITSYISKLESIKINSLLNNNISETINKFSEKEILPRWLSLFQDLLNK